MVNCERSHLRCEGRWLAMLLCTASCLTTLQCAGEEVDTSKPLKVYILAGQSNMDGQAHVRTIDFLGEDKQFGDLLKLVKPDGKRLVTRGDVWVAHRGVYGDLGPGYGGRRADDALGNKIGPEYAFGCRIGERSSERVLLIKVAAGGTSLYQDWRPPSAGLPQDVDPQKVGRMYRALVSYVHATLRDLKQRFPEYREETGYQIAGLVWFQGFNDLFHVTGRKEYGQNLVHLIRDLRREFSAPKMRVVVGVMGVNGVDNEKNPKQKDVRDGQRFVNTVPEFRGTVKAIETAPWLHPEIVKMKCAGWLYPERDLKKQPLTDEEQAILARATSDKGYHYYGSGRFFVLLGAALADAMLELEQGGTKPADALGAP
ncbi:MAG TPA: hypothetical protein DCY79_17920 [Planctomycetaceae bacterium]|nr:hypothetical protein [Blastopirellula sp.]HAY81684.1 hypothetical protein [Planctomycetaceae bacterium]